MTKTDKSRSLKLAKDLTLPLDAVTQTIAILAKRRAGKSYTMRRLTEQLLKAGQQVVIVDPKGDQWGLRSAADGKAPGLPIVILGGERGDVPLEASSGEIVAKLVVEERVSVLLDLSLFRKHEVATFMTAFLENLYRLKAKEIYRTPVMLVIDEADAVAPQKPQKGEERMLGAAEDIVRRGGQRGIGCVLVTQRSAVLNKNVLTQAQVLVVLRTIAPQDLAAMKAWVDVHGDAEQGRILMESLPSLPVGDAWFWSPGWPTTDGIFKRVHVLPIETFDSGASPKPGVKPVEPKNLADVDLDALKGQMAATIEKAKADDPRELRKQIADLTKQLKFIPAEKIVPAGINSPTKIRQVLTDADRAQLAKLTDHIARLSSALDLDIAKLIEDVRVKVASAVNVATSDMLTILRRTDDEAAERLHRVGFQKILGKLSTYTPTHSEAGSRTTPAASQGRRVAPAAATSRPASLPPNRVGEAGLSGPEQRIVDAIAEIQASFGIERPDCAMVAWLARYSPTSTSFTNTRGALRTKGLIDLGGDGTLWLTDAGRGVAMAPETPLTNQELHRRAMDRLTGPERRILEPLLAAWPNALSNEDVAAAAAYSVISTSYTNPRGHLAALGLITYPQSGQVRAADVLFPEDFR